MGGPRKIQLLNAATAQQWADYEQAQLEARQARAALLNGPSPGSGMTQQQLSDAYAAAARRAIVALNAMTEVGEAPGNKPGAASAGESADPAEHENG